MPKALRTAAAKTRQRLRRLFAHARNLIPTFRPSTQGLVLDISDLLIFFATHGFVTGIQRVQLEIVTAVLDGRASLAEPDLGVSFCSSQFGLAWLLDQRDLSALVHAAETGEVDVTRARKLVRRARSRSQACRLAKGARYLVLGSFWADPDIEALCANCQRQGGAFGVLVHDLFAITMRALCEEGAAAWFEAKFRAGLKAWDFIIANSNHTAAEVARYAADGGFSPAPPILAVPLAHHHSRFAAGSRDVAAALPQALTGRPFVLCVGTLEPRKNHERLIQAWTLLGQKHADLPELVLVGRRGWRMETLAAQLKEGAFSASKIHWLEAVSEPQLEALYAACLFVTLPSLAEGWGLPIGEALSCGKACLAANTAAMPEVGGAFATYVDPTDIAALQDALEALIYDPAKRQAQEALIRHAFRPRTWSDVAEDLFGQVRQLR